MPIRRLKAERFRCLSEIDISFVPGFNIVVGPNASGKTSLLEAIAYLGRARSFRGAPAVSLVQHGNRDFVLFGTVLDSGRERNLGVRNGSGGLEVRINGASNLGAADLAAALPLQVIDPDVHLLVAGGPEERRRYLDGIAFHVEHGFLDAWRRYRRILRQRNAALKIQGDSIEPWTKELVEAGLALDESRRRVLDVCVPILEEQASVLVGENLSFEYRRGWKHDLEFETALQDSLERDRAAGTTNVGPHRADLKLVYDDRLARRLVSRGQQKLLACSMVLAAAELTQSALEEPLVLLLDDPAAELDSKSLSRLVAQVTALGCQVIATSLVEGTPAFPAPTALFHVEQGNVVAEV